MIIQIENLPTAAVSVLGEKRNFSAVQTTLLNRVVDVKLKRNY